MAKILNPEQYKESMSTKGEIRYKETQRLLLFGLPWTFTKYELILRLKEMNFAFVDSNYEKQDLITLYDIATSYRNNIEKIYT